MVVSLIAAMAENRVIGCKGRIPWDLPEDLHRFRELTWGHPIVVGRKTFESIGRPLPGRRNIVLTRQDDFQAEGCMVVHSLEAALEAAAGSCEVFICGGAEVYRAALPHAQRIYLTIVHVTAEGDAFFPEIPPGFREVERRGSRDRPPCEFAVYERFDLCSNRFGKEGGVK